jgi:cobyric acid synthase
LSVLHIAKLQSEIKKAPENFSVLELISNNNKGLRLPQLTAAERDAITDNAFKENGGVWGKYSHSLFSQSNILYYFCK